MSTIAQQALTKAILPRRRYIDELKGRKARLRSQCESLLDEIEAIDKELKEAGAEEDELLAAAAFLLRGESE